MVDSNNWLFLGLGIMAGITVLAVVLYFRKGSTAKVPPKTNEETWEYTDRLGNKRVITVHRRVE